MDAHAHSDERTESETITQSPITPAVAIVATVLSYKN
jgi:hypothetical protein